MARSRLYIIAALALCVFATGCAKKAKMRTVPRSAPAAGTGIQGAPSVPPPVDDGPAPQAPPTKNPEVARPAPAPANPVTRLDDDGDSRRRVHVPSAPRRTSARRDEGDCCRPQPRKPVRREVIVEDCNPAPVREQYSRPAPRRHDVVVAPAPRQKVRVEPRQQFELDPTDELHCRWEPTGKPMTYMKFDPVTKVASVQHGWPQKWSHYKNVRLVTGLPPYAEEGLSLVSKSGVPIAHLKATGNGKIWYETSTSYPYESYFGEVPGAPQGEAIRGVCWTKSEPAKTEQNGG